MSLFFAKSAATQAETITEPSSKLDSKTPRNATFSTSISTETSTSTSTTTSNTATMTSVKPQQHFSSAAAQAYYHKQLKYGIYQKPGQPVVGVPKHSSDSAALLATKSDLSLKLWHPELSAAAGTAANVANINQKPFELWRPEHLSSEAASAALYAKDRTSPVREVTPSFNAASASSAALSAHGTTGRDFAASARPDAYEWEERQRSNSTSASSIGRHASIHAMKEQYANGRRRSSSSVSSEVGFDPKNLGILEQAAREKAKERLSKLYLASHSGGGSLEMSAAGSNAALKLAELHELEDPLLAYTPAYLDKDKHLYLIEQAKARTEESMRQIDKQVGEWDLHRNPEFNAAALAVAEKISQKRMENHGKIDLGGGLFMTQSEVEVIAQRNVQPALDQIAVEVEAQLQADEEQRQIEEEERIQKSEQKRIRNEQKAEDKRIREEEAAKKKAEKNRLKAEEKQRKAEQRAIDKAEREKVKSKIKADKLQLKARLAAAEQADAMAKAEVQRTNALRVKAEAELEAARIAEQSAAEGEEKDSLARQVAEKEVALKEAEDAASKARQEEIRSDSIVTSTMAEWTAAERQDTIDEEVEGEDGSEEEDDETSQDHADGDWHLVDGQVPAEEVDGNEGKLDSPEKQAIDATDEGTVLAPVKSSSSPKKAASGLITSIKSGFRKARKSISSPNNNEGPTQLTSASIGAPMTVESDKHSSSSISSPVTTQNDKAEVIADSSLDNKEKTFEDSKEISDGVSASNEEKDLPQTGSNKVESSSILTDKESKATKDSVPNSRKQSMRSETLSSASRKTIEKFSVGGPVETADSTATSHSLASSAAASLLKDKKPSLSSASTKSTDGGALASIAARAALGTEDAAKKTDKQQQQPQENKSVKQEPSQSNSASDAKNLIVPASTRRHDNERTFSGFSSTGDLQFDSSHGDAKQGSLDKKLSQEEDSEQGMLQAAIDTVKGMVNQGDDAENQSGSVFKEEVS